MTWAIGRCRVAGYVDGAGGASASGGSVGVGDAQVEPAFKEAPGDVGGVEQVADVLAGHAEVFARGGADIASWIGVVDIRESAAAVSNDRGAGIESIDHAVGLA